MVEIERKFLVNSDAFKEEAFNKTRLIQGYLNSDKARTVRVRVAGDSGFITVKGKSIHGGLARFEWEKEIPKAEAEVLLELCEPEIIDKIRYKVKCGSHVFEVDVFLGENSGLIVAEVELNHINENFEQPIWLSDEVTGDIKYYNSQLSKNPFIKW